MPYKWVVVLLLWFVCLFNYADRQAIFSVFPLLKTEMGLSDVQLGIVGGAFMWIYAATALFAGMVADRVARKTLIIGGLVFWSAVTIATALSTTYWHLVLFRALEGFGEAFYFPASMSMLSAYHGPDTRSRAMSIHQSSVYAGTILGGSVAGVMGQFLGWRSNFFLFGGLGVLLGVLLLGWLKEPGRAGATDARRTPAWDGVGDLLRNRMVLILMAVFVGANFVAMIALTWMPSFLYRKFAMSLSMAGFSATVYLQVASVAGVISGGMLADRWARRRRGGRMMAQALGLLAGVPFVFLTGWTLSMPLLIVGMVGFGYFKGLYDANIFASLHDVVPVERRATAVGLMNAVGWLGGGTAPVVIGAASARFGMSACISANAGIYLFCGLLLLSGIGRFMSGPIRVKIS